MPFCASFHESEWKNFLKQYKMTDEELRQALFQKYGIEDALIYHDLISLPERRVYFTRAGGENN